LEACPGGLYFRPGKAWKLISEVQKADTGVLEFWNFVAEPESLIIESWRLIL
jgi:hypothetical protein